MDISQSWNSNILTLNFPKNISLKIKYEASINHKICLGLYNIPGIKINFFDLDIKGQGQSDGILIPDTPYCLNTFT
jgi:hypothetical protein